MLQIDPIKAVPDFKERPFNFKYLAGEMMWYMSKEKTLDKIQMFSKFWNNITNPDGTINSNYGNLLFGEQLRWVYESLVNDKDTRQAIAFLNQPKFQYQGNKDFVCTMYLNFFIRHNKLNMKMTIRSNDIVFGFSYDAPFFSFIMQYIYLWLKQTAYPELELGTYYHYADNIHYYERHFDVMEKIKNTPEYEEKPQPKFELKKLPFIIGRRGECHLTNEGEEFCNIIEEMGKNDIKFYMPYIDALRKFIRIDFPININQI
jgi:thymidylate synthase